MSNKQIAESIRQEITRLTERLREIESAPESVKIHYSIDKKHYYVTDTEQDRPRYWMSVANIEKPENISDSPFTPSYLEIRRASTGVGYWKEILSFNFWKIKSGEVEELSRNSDLYQDYGSLMQWKELAA